MKTCAHLPASIHHGHSLTVALLFLTGLSTQVLFAYEPPAATSPIVEGAFSSPQEYASAIKVRDERNVGWFYNQYATNWHSTNTLTFFKLHAFDDPGYGQLDLYDLNSFEIMWGTNFIKTWVFLTGDEYPTNDLVWLTEVGMGGYSVFDDNGGFLVRLNNDPTTDRRWVPGNPKPGEPGWNFTNYYGVFAYGDLNNSSFTMGYNNVQPPRELYEWSITFNYQPDGPGGGAPPPGGGMGLPTDAPGGGGNPPVPGICTPIWTNIVATNTVTDWKPRMGGWGTIGGIGFVPTNYWVFMGWDTSKHPFHPVLFFNPIPWNPGTVVLTTGSILTYYQPTNYVVLDDTPADPNRSVVQPVMTTLELSGGSLPPGLRFRENPTAPSRGGSLIQPQPDGTHRISSFFDVFTEVSIDGGMSWLPATNGPVRLNLAGGNPPNQFPINTLPPNAGRLVTPQGSQVCFANGIIVSNLMFHGFVDSFPPPPPGPMESHVFLWQAKLDLSVDGGLTFTSHAATADVSSTIANSTVEVMGGTIPIELPVQVRPAFVMVNATNNYLLYGPGGLAGSCPLIKQGPGQLTLETANSFTGGASLTDGTLALGNNLALGAGPIVLSHGTLKSSSPNPLEIPNSLRLLGDPTLGAEGTGPIIFTAPSVDVGLDTQTLTVNSPVTFVGALTNTGGLVKAGPAPLILHSEATYSGPTLITEGVLALLGSGALSHSSPVLVQSVLDAGGRIDHIFWAGEGQTVGGNGIIIATKMIVGPGATLSPGTSIGRLTVSGDLAFSAGSTNLMELDKATATNDVILSTGPGGTILFAGTLVLTNVGPSSFASGDGFKLFTASAYSGVFDRLVPPAPGPGLAWNTGTLALDGVLRVASATATNPTNISAVVINGATLHLSWPADHIGWTLQVQANPLAVGLSTNWVAMPDSITTNHVFLPINPDNGCLFYRLTYPLP